MRAIIFLNGTPVSERALNSVNIENALVICADGAFDYIKGKITPDIILGDFDSVSDKSFPETSEVLTFPPEKDFTDGHLAVQTAIDRGADEIEIYGAFGGRPDHAYSNLSLLYQSKQAGAVAVLYDENWRVYLLDGAVKLSASANKYVSIVPFFESAHIISTKGLKYPMQNVTLNRQHILGISNEATESEIEFFANGEVLVFVEL